MPDIKSRQFFCMITLDDKRQKISVDWPIDAEIETALRSIYSQHLSKLFKLMGSQVQSEDGLSTFDVELQSWINSHVIHGSIPKPEHYSDMMQRYWAMLEEPRHERLDILKQYINTSVLYSLSFQYLDGNYVSADIRKVASELQTNLQARYEGPKEIVTPEYDYCIRLCRLYHQVHGNFDMASLVALAMDFTEPLALLSTGVNAEDEAIIVGEHYVPDDLDLLSFLNAAPAQLYAFKQYFYGEDEQALSEDGMELEGLAAEIGLKTARPE